MIKHLNKYKPIQVPILYKNNPFPEYNDILCGIEVLLTKEEYELAEKSSFNMASSHKTPSRWNNGYINNKNDPRRAERTGRLGEIAFAKITNTFIDLSYQRYGDKMDTLYKGKSINVKTSRAMYGNIRISAMNSNGKYKVPIQDLFVFSLLYENKNDKYANIIIYGYLPISEILKKPIIYRRYIINHECKYSEIYPINKLFEIYT